MSFYLPIPEIDGIAFQSWLTTQVASFAYSTLNDYSLKHLLRNGELELGWQEMLQSLQKMVDPQQHYSDPTHEEEVRKKCWDILGTLKDEMEIKLMEELEEML